VRESERPEEYRSGMTADTALGGRTRIGSATGGTGAAPTRVDLLLGSVGGPLESAWISALASPAAAHVVVVVELRPGLPVRPATLLIAPVAAPSSSVADLVQGPAQAAVAAAIARAVEQDVISRAEAAGLMVLVRLDLGATTDTPDQVFANVVAVMHDAFVAAINGTPTIDEVLAEAGHPWNAGYHRHRN
jgi:5,6,7,8-tetrahydromethanopterin hydro-lyase